MSKTAVMSAARGRRVKRDRDYNETLPAYIPQAAEFSDDTSLTDRMSVLKLVKEHLSGGDGPVGTLWDEISEACNLQQEGGRDRNPGDWPLMAVSLTMSRRAELYPWWDDELADPMWELAGFPLRKKDGLHRPGHSLVALRISELEDERCVNAFERAGDKLVQLARSKDKRVGRDVYVDFTAIHSRARLHHDCPDPVACVELMKKQGKRVPKVLAIAAEEEVRTKRGELAEVPEDEIDQRVAPTLITAADNQEGRYKRYVSFNGHRYGVLDPDAGVRAYNGLSSGKRTVTKFWVGGTDGLAVDGFTGGALAHTINTATVMEYNAFPALLRKVERALDDEPEVIAADRGLGVTKTYRRLALRGIAPVMPFRGTGHVKEFGQLRTADFDEHGPRCGFCGAPGSIVGAKLGMFRKESGTLALYFRCADPHTADCITKRQHKNFPTGRIKPKDPTNILWRFALGLSPMTERYQAILHTQFHFESNFRHQRKRYLSAGNDETGKLKRLGLGAHRLRAAISRFIEWFRICLRHGWLGNHPKTNERPVRYRRGEHKLYRVLCERREQGINLPYGPAAHALVLRRTAEIPPWREPVKKKPPGSKS